MSTIAKASQHAWVYAVLIEMNDYCRNEGLEEVSASITRAIAQMEPVIFPSLPAAGPHEKPRRVSPFAANRPVGAQKAEVLPFPQLR